MFVHKCGTRSAEVAQGNTCKWNARVIGYFENCAWPRLTREQVAGAYDRAASYWSKCANVTLYRVDSEQRADIVAGVGPIDGPGKILALSDLPVGDDAVLRQTFDSAEDWGPESLDMLEACMCHELGHCLGLEHILNQNALLDPYIVPGRDCPQAPDVAAIQALYGPAEGTSVEPTVNVDVPGDFEAVGRKYAPYVVGVVADAIMRAAQNDQVFALNDADLNTLRQAFFAVVAPGLPANSGADALRQVARGLAFSLRG